MKKTKFMRRVFSEMDESQKEELVDAIEELKTTDSNVVELEEGLTVEATDEPDKFIVTDEDAEEATTITESDDEFQFEESTEEEKQFSKFFSRKSKSIKNKKFSKSRFSRRKFDDVVEETPAELVTDEPVEVENTAENTQVVENPDGTVTETTTTVKTYSRKNYSKLLKNRIRKFSDEAVVEITWKEGDTAQFMLGTTMCFGTISEIEDGKAEISIDNSCGVDITEVKVPVEKLMTKVETSFSDIPSDEKTAEELGTPEDQMPDVPVEVPLADIKVDTDATAVDPVVEVKTVEEVVDSPEVDPENQEDIAGEGAEGVKTYDDSTTDESSEKVGKSIDENLQAMNSAEPAIEVTDETKASDENPAVPLLDPDVIEVNDNEKLFSKFDKKTSSAIDNLLQNSRIK